jgi:hypothetical protein
VDLDLFLELPLRRKDWERLPGTTLSLALMDGTLELVVPEDADPSEIWTFAGEGLLDEDAEEETGPVGDLHVIPLVR